MMNEYQPEETSKLAPYEQVEVKQEPLSSQEVNTHKTPPKVSAARVKKEKDHIQTTPNRKDKSPNSKRGALKPPSKESTPPQAGTTTTRKGIKTTPERACKTTGSNAAITMKKEEKTSNQKNNAATGALNKRTAKQQRKQ